MLTDAYSVFLRLSAIILSFSRGWSSQKNQLQSPNNTDPMCWNQCEIRLTVGRHVVLSEVPKFGDGSKPFCTVFWRDEHAEHPFTSYFVGFAIGSHWFQPVAIRMCDALYVWICQELPLISRSQHLLGRMVGAEDLNPTAKWLNRPSLEAIQAWSGRTWPIFAPDVPISSHSVSQW